MMQHCTKIQKSNFNILFLIVDNKIFFQNAPYPYFVAKRSISMPLVKLLDHYILTAHTCCWQCIIWGDVCIVLAEKESLK